MDSQIPFITKGIQPTQSASQIKPYLKRKTRLLTILDILLITRLSLMK